MQTFIYTVWISACDCGIAGVYDHRGMTGIAAFEKKLQLVEADKLVTKTTPSTTCTCGKPPKPRKAEIHVDYMLLLGFYGAMLARMITTI